MARAAQRLPFGSDYHDDPESLQLIIAFKQASAVHSIISHAGGCNQYKVLC